ncbi:MAG TPA: baseplate J/gp47 family protein, partial [Candidatus Angelobacter sp.]|nr:baseplate J/gp47 family protein [Candidatus Angelobacter sp.]
PDRAKALQSAMSFRLLKRYADSYGKRVNLVSGDARLQGMALEAGFAAYPTLAAYDNGGEVHQPGAVAESSRVPAVSSPPAAPAAVATTIQPVAPVSDGPRGVATLDRPRAASVVSGTPRRPPPPPSRPAASGPPLRVYRPYLIAAGVLVVLGLIAGILYLPTATATLVVSGTAIKQDVTLLGAPGTAAASGNQFATQAFHAEESQNLPGTPTGQKSIAAVAASGTVVFTLSCAPATCSYSVPAGTDVSTTSPEKHYVTQKSVAVSSGHPGSAPVVSVQAGAIGNTDIHSIQNVNTNNPDGLLVDNPAAITSGADARTATVIQQSDLDSIRDAYSKDAIPQVTDQLNSKAQGLKLVLVGQGVQASVTSDHKVGEEVPGFTVTVKVAGDGVAFDEKVIKQLLKTALERKISQGSQLTSNVTTTYEAIDATTDGHITLNGHVSGFYTPVFLQANIRGHLKGLSPAKAHAFLQSLPNVVDARVTQSPYGLPWLPLFSSRITLKIQEVSSSSTSP